MAGMSNYSQHPCGPQWLMYSRVGGAVRRRTPSLLPWSPTMDGSRFNIPDTEPQIFEGMDCGFLPTLIPLP